MVTNNLIMLIGLNLDSPSRHSPSYPKSETQSRPYTKPPPPSQSRPYTKTPPSTEQQQQQPKATPENAQSHAYGPTYSTTPKRTAGSTKKNRSTPQTHDTKRMMMLLGKTKPTASELHQVDDNGDVQMQDDNPVSVIKQRLQEKLQNIILDTAKEKEDKKNKPVSLADKIAETIKKVENKIKRRAKQDAEGDDDPGQYKAYFDMRQKQVEEEIAARNAARERAQEAERLEAEEAARLEAERVQQEAKRLMRETQERLEAEHKEAEFDRWIQEMENLRKQEEQEEKEEEERWRLEMERLEHERLRLEEEQNKEEEKEQLNQTMEDAFPTEISRVLTSDSHESELTMTSHSSGKKRSFLKSKEPIRPETNEFKRKIGEQSSASGSQAYHSAKDEEEDEDELESPSKKQVYSDGDSDDDEDSMEALLESIKKNKKDQAKGEDPPGPPSHHAAAAASDPSLTAAATLDSPQAGTRQPSNTAATLDPSQSFHDASESFSIGSSDRPGSSKNTTRRSNRKKKKKVTYDPSP